jgi:anti-sigma factor ChrR (cupin superfamily)
VRHVHPTDEIREQAALYALGALDPAEVGSFESHLAEGCPTCEREIQAFTAVIDDLAHATAPKPPAPELRRRLLGAISTDSAGALAPIVERAGEARWEATGTPGMEVRRLFVDHGRSRSTVLVRMAAGATHPAHRHADTEELYVLDGDLTVGPQLLGAGDYCGVAAGTTYGPLHTDAGCAYVLLLPEGDTVPPGDVSSASGLFVVRSGDGAWRDGPAPGVSIRRLFADSARKAVTAHVRMRPGARLPRDRRVMPEQFYLLRGDAHVGGYVLQAGDFYCAPAGRLHDVAGTESGCEFLLLSSGVEILA